MKFTQVLSLAALVAPATLAQPCLSADFSLAMRFGGGSENPIYLSLNIISDPSADGTLIVVGERLAQYPGTPGPSGNASLAFEIDSANSDCGTIPTGSYGIFVGDVGENYGIAISAIASLNQSWPHFYYADGQVGPQMTAASQLWFACNRNFNGQNYQVLSWGIYNNNGSAPTGCQPTEVIQMYNIPCSGS